MRELKDGRCKSAHAGDVNCVRFGPYIEKVESDETSHGFETAMERQDVFRVAVSGNAPISTDMVLASCGDDGTVRLWRLKID